MSESELTGYENEPREYFHNLSPELHTRFYHHERLSHDLTAEIHYYVSQLPGLGLKILELGCGTSLLSNGLRSRGFEVTGIDINKEALLLAGASPANRLVQMDMCALGFQPCFDGVIIAQNTLNLLTDKTTIRNCLKEVKRVLVRPGLLLTHLYCIEPQQKENPEKRSLQFQMFDHPEGGTIIKETIRSLNSATDILVLEERYKVRRFSDFLPDINYRHHLSLAALSREQWLELFAEAGFTIRSVSTGFADNKVQFSSALHLVAHPS